MLRLIVAGLAVAALAAPAAAEYKTATIVIKDHKFEPAELHVPAGTRMVVTVDNQDPTPEEFESHELKVEKVIPGGTSAKVRFGPLEAGSYPFFGEFNEATAQGKVIAE
jgi:plastocyanin